MVTKTAAESRLIMVSNRLPIVLTKASDGQWRIEPSSGGLISALAPVLRDRGGIWIGWPGTVAEDTVDLDPLMAESSAVSGFTLTPVILTALERDRFYLGFSNEIIWPLFHDLQSRCNFDPTYWTTYEAVNRTFAQTIMSENTPADYIWVHDYHLINVARELRLLGARNSLGFFLHIPFPPLDIFLKLPWRFEILRALLEYDLIGLQTGRDRHNFVECVRTLLPEVALYDQRHIVAAQVGDREVRIGSFPIGIDFEIFTEQAATARVAQTAQAIHAALAHRQIIFSTDRLDYTKGILQKLEAFRYALLRFPDLRQQITLIQVVVPSRADIPEYADLKNQIERLVSEINGQFTEAGWVPIHYIYRSLEWIDLIAYYRAADIALITPLKDGMNLVAKEYCTCGPEDGVLILSEFAGAAAQLHRDALLVNPYDVDGCAAAIQEAVTMKRAERRRRMHSLRQVVRDWDIFWWVDAFLLAGTAHHLADFPLVDAFVPSDTRYSIRSMRESNPLLTL